MVSESVQEGDEKGDAMMEVFALISILPTGKDKRVCRKYALGNFF